MIAIAKPAKVDFSKFKTFFSDLKNKINWSIVLILALSSIGFFICGLSIKMLTNEMLERGERIDMLQSELVKLKAEKFVTENNLKNENTFLKAKLKAENSRWCLPSF